mmetsp:Transcript_10129/g.25354  ORF Transcript_10129/g.25354 Transcript_10129/m.25354 type:complete len:476 (+) Transcript_10129:86-1513(+)
MHPESQVHPIDTLAGPSGGAAPPGKACSFQDLPLELSCLIVSHLSPDECIRLRALSTLFLDVVACVARDKKWQATKAVKRAFLRHVVAGRIEPLRFMMTYFWDFGQKKVSLALSCACESGNEGMAKFLCRSFRPYAEGTLVRALTCSSSRGHLRVLKFLCREFSLSAAQKTLVHEALWHSAGNGHLLVVQFLCRSFELDRRDVCTGDYAALRWAAENDRLDALEFLMLNFPIGDVDRGIFYPVSIGRCISRGSVATVRFLCQFFMINTIPHGAVSRCCRHGHKQMLEYLYFQVSAERPLYTSNRLEAFRLAAAHGHLQIVVFLAVHLGLTRDEACVDGCEALWSAARGGHLGVIKFLCLYFNLPPAAVRANNNEALVGSAAAGHADVVHFLLEFCPYSLREAWRALQAACTGTGSVQVARALTARFGFSSADLRDLCDAAAVNANDELAAFLSAHLNERLLFWNLSVEGWSCVIV